MSDDVTMEVPDDISVVGWFDRSVRPSSRKGNTVLVGHRDGASDPNGVFRNLGDMGTSDLIEVTDSSGRLTRYRVDSVKLLDRNQFANKATQIFATSGLHQLVLITCGGSYDADRGGYQANIVVTATRA